ncbi:unnamed protein product, partial [marine sediment metagenome]
MKIKRIVAVIGSACLIVALVALSVMSCAEPIETGGVLKISVGIDANTLGHPPTLTRMGDFRKAAASVETLVRTDEAGTPVPWLAKTWKVDAQAKTITFTLEKGVKFHDGTDFNAEAVKWNLEQYMASPRIELNKVESIDIVDDYTIRLNLSEFDALLLPNLAAAAGLMISPTAYQTYGQEWCATHPLGTGPFKFVSWDRDVSIKFERFDDYWQKGKPYLDGVEWVIIADPMVATASFLAGEQHIATQIEPKDARDLEDSGEFTIAMSVRGGLHAICGDAGNPDSIFANIKVRQAVEHAIDKQAICDTIGYGYWTPVYQAATPASWAYNPDVVGYPYNPEKARQLLTEAGYPNGFQTTIFTMNTPAHIVSIMTAIQGYLSEVGIDAEMDIMDHGRFYGIFAGGGWQDGITVFPMGLSPDELGLINRIYTPESVLFGT